MPMSASWKVGARRTRNRPRPVNGGEQDTPGATTETIGETTPEDIGTDDSWSDEADNGPEIAASEAAPEVEPEANEPALRDESRLSAWWTAWWRTRVFIRR